VAAVAILRIKAAYTNQRTLRRRLLARPSRPVLERLWN